MLLFEEFFGFLFQKHILKIFKLKEIRLLEYLYINETLSRKISGFFKCILYFNFAAVQHKLTHFLARILYIINKSDLISR